MATPLGIGSCLGAFALIEVASRFLAVDIRLVYGYLSKRPELEVEGVKGFWNGTKPPAPCARPPINTMRWRAFRLRTYTHLYARAPLQLRMRTYTHYTHYAQGIWVLF